MARRDARGSRPLLLDARSLRAMPVPEAREGCDKDGRGCVLVRAVLAGLSRMPRAGRPSLVLDAEPLALVAKAPGMLHALEGRVVVTPHAGEMATMTGIAKGDVRRAPLAVAREAARTWRAVVALKGAETFVCAPDGRAARNVAGNVGLATSGSGDALAGLVAGLVARGSDPFEAACWAVHVHAAAGDVLARKLAPLGFLARERLAEIPAVLANLGAPQARAPRRRPT